MIRLSFRRLSLLALAAGLLPGLAFAQGAAPAKIGLVVMLKVLTYDKGFPARGSGEFVVVIASEPGQEAALAEVQSAAEALKGTATAINGRPLKFVTVQANRPDLKAALQGAGANAVVSVPGLSPTTAKSVAAAALGVGAYPLSLDPTLCESGDSAVCVQNNAGKPQIVINLSASQKINAQFAASVLKLAKIVS